MINFSHSKVPVVLVDDEPSELDAYGFLLTSMGVNQVIQVQDSRRLPGVMADLGVCVLFLDLNMPHKSGLEVLKELRVTHPHIPTVIITANSEVESAVQCLKQGAHDYLVKPINMNTFASALRNALEICALRNEVLTLKGVSFNRDLKRPDHFQHIITQNPTMIGLFHYIESISTSREPVLILGETGTGKELISRAIHNASGLEGPFVTVDVAGLDDNLFSDTLFGHSKGAYTGADKNREGLVEKAAGGSLFLDEIGDLSAASQVKLLRLVQEGIFYPLGSDQPRTCKARIISATNKSRTELAAVDQDQFRSDLFFRLSTHLIQVPPLRERKEDIPLIAAFLRDQAAKAMGKPVVETGQQVADVLSSHPFPGNIRELKTYIYDAVAQSTDTSLNVDSILERLADTPTVPQPRTSHTAPVLEDLMGRFPTLTALTEYAIAQALERTDNNQSQAAKLLGISKQALSKRLKSRDKS
ncbi:sigma-54 dependent transcriptional regulator [uncultured Desulfobacter sp.]|uniref:sigma-54-dependent transcriptional regulator n=1 Tax=uncultured Desulfobacter sp. TaxID=240139 RepID=UPI002AAA7CB1|nr:sigma-54 dependent transcriptional regulator [uncultured Desulfobacter sp.]